MTFPYFIELYTPVSKMWAVRLNQFYKSEFFDLIPKEYRQLKPSHWTGGLCYKGIDGKIHMFFTMGYLLQEDIFSGKASYSLSKQPENLLHLELDEIIAKEYFMLLHEYPIDKKMDKHFVK